MDVVRLVDQPMYMSVIRNIPLPWCNLLCPQNTSPGETRRRATPLPSTSIRLAQCTQPILVRAVIRGGGEPRGGGGLNDRIRTPSCSTSLRQRPTSTILQSSVRFPSCPLLWRGAARSLPRTMKKTSPKITILGWRHACDIHRGLYLGELGNRSSAVHRDVSRRSILRYHRH